MSDLQSLETLSLDIQPLARALIDAEHLLPKTLEYWIQNINPSDLDRILIQYSYELLSPSEHLALDDFVLHNIQPNNVVLESLISTGWLRLDDKGKIELPDCLRSFVTPRAMLLNL